MNSPLKKLVAKIRRKLRGKRPLIVPTDIRFSHKPLKFYETTLGKYYLPADALRDPVAKAMRRGRVYEPEIVEEAKRYITRGSVVLDVGANFGQMSLLFSKFVGAKGEVLAFEANDYIFHILEKNIQANNAKNIHPYLRGVYDLSGKLILYPEPDFTQSPSYGSFGLDPRATEGREVSTLAIDDLNIHSPISFMKIDIQGSDLFALRGAVETIRRHQMPIVFEFEQGIQEKFNTSFQDYLDLIEDFSYHIIKVISSADAVSFLIVPINKGIRGN